MALIMLAGAGYAYYQTQLSQSFDVELDEALERAGKEAVEFLPSELTRGILKVSVSTVTFCEGDFRKAAPFFEKRVKAIREANPWLTGFLAPPEGGGDLRLWYDSDTSSDRFQKAPRSFKCFEPGEIPLTQLTPFKQYDEIVHSYDVKVPTTDHVVGKNVALWKVSLIPDAAEPDGKFIVISSMCRLLGDSQTYYMLYNQLNPSVPVSSLNIRRKVEFKDQAKDYLGEQESQYLGKLGENVKREKGEDDGPLKAFFSGSATKEDKEPAHEVLVFRVANSWMNKEKEQHPDVDETSLVVSWFFRKIRPEIVLLAMTLRNILPALNDSDAGNYSMPVPMISEDYDTPQGIQSTLKGKRKTYGEVPLPEVPSSFGIGADWSRFGKAVDGDEEDAAFKQTMHFPLLDTDDLLCMPKNVCGIVVFKASAGQLGALCIIPKGMKSEFSDSGIVDETVTQLQRLRYNRWQTSVRASQQASAAAAAAAAAAAQVEDCCLNSALETLQVATSRDD